MIVDTSHKVIHETACVSPAAAIGEGTQIWNNAQVREGAIIGKNCHIGSGAYIGKNVLIGNNCKIGNNACLFEGVTLEDGVFCGPGSICCNDKTPRAVNKDGELVGPGDWKLLHSYIGGRASIGANVTILPGVFIATESRIGAGAVVTRDTEEGRLYIGNPAQEVGDAR